MPPPLTLRRSEFLRLALAAGAFGTRLVGRAASGSAGQRAVSAAAPALAVSSNRRYLVTAAGAEPVFLLGDTAWNLIALTDEDFSLYLSNRARHGFNLFMFALDFAPQASARDAYGDEAYSKAGQIELNPRFFRRVESRVRAAADRGMYVMLYPLWSGAKAGTINSYSPEQLHRLGLLLGRRFADVPNVLWSAGGEASPPFADLVRVKALGSGLKTGSAGRSLVTVHPMAEHNSAEYYGACSWLDFCLIQAKSGNGAGNALYDAAALVAKTWDQQPLRPVMMGEHRYESGTGEDPLIQRRSLYQCVFAGACGHVYGHDALWQMTPHTGQPWMLQGWNPGVKRWQDALDTAAVDQLHHIRNLLAAMPLPHRLPDQSLILAGEGKSVATRVRAVRDGTAGQVDATYVAAYLSAPLEPVLDVSVIAEPVREVFVFHPSSGQVTSLESPTGSARRLALARFSAGTQDSVVIVAGANAPCGQRLRLLRDPSADGLPVS